MTEELARHYLRDIDPPWKGFWFHMHSMARNLSEFAEGMEDITDEVYDYHNSGQKQDFAAWAQEVVGDSLLARKLLAVSGKEEAAKVVQERVVELKKALNRPS